MTVAPVRQVRREARIGVVPPVAEGVSGDLLDLRVVVRRWQAAPGATGAPPRTSGCETSRSRVCSTHVNPSGGMSVRQTRSSAATVHETSSTRWADAHARSRSPNASRSRLDGPGLPGLVRADRKSEDVGVPRHDVHPAPLRAARVERLRPRPQASPSTGSPTRSRTTYDGLSQHAMVDARHVLAEDAQREQLRAREDRQRRRQEPEDRQGLPGRQVGPEHEGERAEPQQHHDESRRGWRDGAATCERSSSGRSPAGRA